MSRYAAHISVWLAVASRMVVSPAAQANDGEAFKARLLAALASGNGRQIAAGGACDAAVTYLLTLGLRTTE